MVHNSPARSRAEISRRGLAPALRPVFSRAPRRCEGARAERRAEGRRAAAALRRPGRHRPGLFARRRDRARIFKDIGLPELAIMNADTETNVEVARSRAEKLIADGAQLLVGAFDSGQSTAIAQVAEQKGIPFVINIAAAPADHRAGLQVRVPQLPDRADDPRRRLRQSEGDLRGRRHRRRSRWCSCMSTTRSARRCRRASAR